MQERNVADFTQEDAPGPVPGARAFRSGGARLPPLSAATHPLRRRVLRLAVVGIPLLLLPFAAYGDTHYVRPDGNNASNGLANTPAGAWQTIDWAADHITSGDVVRVQPGTYSERVTPAVNGSSVANTVTFVADGSATVCGFELANSSYIRIIGFLIDTNAGTCSKTYGCVLLSGANSFLEFWNNTFTDATYNGIRIGVNDTINNSLIVGNLFSSFGIGNGSGVAVGIRGNNNLVAYNETYNSHPDVFMVMGVQNRWVNNYSHDLSEASGGHSDVFQSGSNVLGLSYNLFEANFQAGIGNTGDEHTAQISHAQAATYCPSGCGAMTENIFRRNVWHNVSSGTIGINQTFDGAVSHTRAYNNTTAGAQRNYATVRYELAWYGTGTINSYLHNNISYKGWGDSASTALEVYYVENGLILDYNLAFDPGRSVTFASPWTLQAHPRSNVNPAFVDYANDNFTLGASSGAIGTGGPLTTVSGNDTGTTFNVAAAGGGFFRGPNTSLTQYGGNLTPGDVITVGNDTVTVSGVLSDAITVTQPFTWSDGEPVFYGAGTTPDIGAYPYKAAGYALTATYSLSGGTATVVPSDASLVRFVVCFEDGIPTTVDQSAPYTCSVGSGSLDVRVYPRFASKMLSVVASAGTPADGGVDGGFVDSGASDAGLDAGASDAGRDGGVADAGRDAGGLDAGPADGGTDGGAPSWDGGNPPSDAGGVIGAASCGCSTGGAVARLAVVEALLLWVPRRLRRHGRCPSDQDGRPRPAPGGSLLRRGR